MLVADEIEFIDGYENAPPNVMAGYVKGFEAGVRVGRRRKKSGPCPIEIERKVIDRLLRDGLNPVTKTISEQYLRFIRP
jgi:hypothetical protein